MGKKRQLEAEEVVEEEVVADEEVEEETVKKPKKDKKDKKSKKKEVKVESESEAEEEEQEVQAAASETDSVPVVKKPVKPLPPGYTCNACGMKDDHAIYNCPSKLSKKVLDKTGGDVAAAQPTAKKAKTEDQPQEEKKKKVFSVFLSGLPFDMNKEKLLDLITDLDDHGTTLTQRNVFIVHFDDNENRCRGLAYVNCPTKEEFDRTLKLNGIKVGRMNITAVESSSKQQDHAAMGGKKKGKTAGETRCYRCGGTHDPKTCTNLRICYKCKGTDHLSKDCPKKKK